MTAKARCNRCGGNREVLEPEKELFIMGHPYVARAHLIPCPDCSVAKARGIVTNAHSQQKSIRPLVLICEIREQKPTVKVEEGGVSGYEGCYFDKKFQDWAVTKGWWACAGTPGKYDGLFIPAKEMKQALETLKLV